MSSSNVLQPVNVNAQYATVPNNGAASRCPPTTATTTMTMPTHTDSNAAIITLSQQQLSQQSVGSNTTTATMSARATSSVAPPLSTAAVTYHYVDDESSNASASSTAEVMPPHAATTSVTTTDNHPYNLPAAAANRDYSHLDPATCPAYVDDIIVHLLRREQTSTRDPRYLSNQPDVTDRMRMILVDWLVDVAIKFKVHPETYYLCVDIVDRYLSRTHVTRSQLQLVGVTAMLLAAKHEEIWAPEVKECIYISANTYTAEEVITMERSIAAELNFKFTVPTSFPFLCNLLDRLHAEQITRNAALFYLDCSSLEYRMLEFLPSIVAGASCFLALLTVFTDMAPVQWLEHYEMATFVPLSNELLDCARILLQSAKNLALQNSRFQAIRRKFSSSRYDGIALLALPEFVPEVVFE